MVGMWIIVQLLTGTLLGIAVGLLGYPIALIKNHTLRNVCKGTYVVFFIFAFNTIGLYTDWSNSIYIGTLAIGWTVRKVWKLEVPEILVGEIWDKLCVFLFSSVGAMLEVKKINSSFIGGSLGCVIPALVIKCAANFFLSACRGFTYKEKLYMALC
jgi:hypothetical protein